MIAIAVTWTQFAVLAVLLIGLLGLFGFVANRRSGPSDEDAAVEQVRNMAGVGRLVLACLGFIALVAGLAADYPVVILFGVASLIAALGQHWVYRNSPRR